MALHMSELKKNVLIIDNYDSFTWNVYEYLSQEGASVQVFRNDKITLEEIEKLNPDTIVISPGPGHPKTDSGVSRACIKHFMGKLPIFGICMGQQCMIDVFGGEVGYAGEIVHGKTSEITHDGKGLFKNVPQGISVTRYHSLAGNDVTLPECLEVTARTKSGVIMGVRHKVYTIEGVQFHPESILTEEGHRIVKNMLSISGGIWEANKGLTDTVIAPTDANEDHPSILTKIYLQRKADVAANQEIPGFSMHDLETNFKLGLAPPVQNFYERLRRIPNGQRAVVLGEFKRASPSKGVINLHSVASEQALIYASAGVCGISVLTEPKWFKGNIQDLVNVRKILDLEYRDNMSARPCVLRKDFIFSKYQILEARLAGADSVLLIVKMLDEDTLKELYDYATTEMGIEPLVEVTSEKELKRAVSIGAKVIGVNNRDLHSFHVDLETTRRLAGMVVPDEVLLIALSGINSARDTESYKREGVHGFLVGEALMKSDNITQLVHDLCA